MPKENEQLPENNLLTYIIEPSILNKNNSGNKSLYYTE